MCFGICSHTYMYVCMFVRTYYVCLYVFILRLDAAVAAVVILSIIGVGLAMGVIIGFLTHVCYKWCKHDNEPDM